MRNGMLDPCLPQSAARAYPPFGGNTATEGWVRTTATPTPLYANH
jgi:hypothetical protein